MEQVISQPNAVDHASLDDHWIIDQLFGIIHLESKINRTLSTCDGQIDPSVRREVADLNARVTRFDKMLDFRQAKNPAASRVRAS